VRAIQCDRCKVFISGDQGYKGVTVMTKHIPDKIEEQSVKHLDFCFKCSDEITSFMATPLSQVARRAA
jgi:hypothetical protein